MYAKRQTISKSLPIPRKGTKYIVVASHEKKNGIPLLIILRDMLKIARNRKEAKKILNSGAVSINDKIIKKENFSVLPFDILKIGEKNYELTFSDKGKFTIKETTKKEKILKVISKKILKKKKIQLNLMYGWNIIANEKVNVGDSVIIDKGKIIKIIPLEKGREAVIFAGKNKGKYGKIEVLENKMASLSCENKTINVPAKNILVIK